MFKTFVGDKKFYKSVFGLMLPIMIQNGITNLVNMLDNDWKSRDCADDRSCNFQSVNLCI